MNKNELINVDHFNFFRTTKSRSHNPALWSHTGRVEGKVGEGSLFVKTLVYENGIKVKL
jgi:hypothetical protein